MSDSVELLRAADRLQVLVQQTGELIKDKTADNRKALLETRRGSAEQMSIIARSGLEFATKRQCANEFRNEFSKLRSAIALHQASWPAVSISSNDPSYQASVAQTREAYRAFLAWLKRNLV